MEAQKEELAEVEQNISQNLTIEDGIRISSAVRIFHQYHTRAVQGWMDFE